MNARHGRSTLAAPHPAHIAHYNTCGGAFSSLNSSTSWVGWADQPSSGHHGNLPSPIRLRQDCGGHGLRRAGITSVQEVIPGGMNLTSAFTYDYENRLTEYAVGGTNFSVEHTYDGYNRLVKTDATIGANTQNFEHVYAGRQHLGNIETTGQPVNGKVWRWEAGAGMPHAGPIESPQRYTASATQFYMVSDERNVERKSYRVASITAGDYNDDSRYAEWQQVNGNVTPTRPALMAYKSEMFNAYQVTLDADRASSAATNHALQLAASDLEYEGTRVKSPVLGRDLNPMGRGDGAYYADGGNTHRGSVAARGVKPALVGNSTRGFGNSVNNGNKGPDPACFSICICAPKCLLDWVNSGKKGFPDTCCNDEEAIEEAQDCCMKDSERKKEWKRDAFNKECLGCTEKAPETPREPICCEKTRGQTNRSRAGICFCTTIGQDQLNPHIKNPVVGFCRYYISINEPIQNRVICNPNDPNQVPAGTLLGWIDVAAIPATAGCVNCSIGTRIDIGQGIPPKWVGPPKNYLSGVETASSFTIPSHASFPAVCGDDYEKQQYGFYPAPMNEGGKDILKENCGAGICQLSQRLLF